MPVNILFRQTRLANRSDFMFCKCWNKRRANKASFRRLLHWQFQIFVFLEKWLQKSCDSNLKYLIFLTDCLQSWQKNVWCRRFYVRWWRGIWSGMNNNHFCFGCMSFWGKQKLLLYFVLWVRFFFFVVLASLLPVRLQTYIYQIYTSTSICLDNNNKNLTNK